MARQLRFFTSEVEKAGILVPPRLSSEQGGLQFDALEGKLAGLEAELLELNSNSSRLHRSYNELLELQVGVLAVGGAGGWVGWAGRRVGLPASSACPAMPCHAMTQIPCTVNSHAAPLALPLTPPCHAVFPAPLLLVLCPCSWCWRVLALSSRMRAPLQTAHSASPPPPPMPTVSPAAACCHCCLHGRLSLHCMLPLLWGVGRDGARCRLHALPAGRSPPGRRLTLAPPRHRHWH